MSHGGGAEHVEPDLTPLLDLVMQLLMFFIVNVNFVGEQVNPDIKLPTSESARPIDKADTQAIFLNQKSMRDRAFVNRLSQADQERLRNAESVVLIPGVPHAMSLLECRAWLKDKYADLARQAPDGQVKTVIHFRPDEELELNQFFLLMQSCKDVGFKKLAVRAIVRGGA
jgi:biopolymer transport protein ExbD